MAEVKWTREAALCLEEIWTYIAADNPTAARRTAAAIHERTERLRTFPEMGAVADADRSIRSLPYGHYRIFYRFQAQDDAVVILSVIHGSRDIGPVSE